MEKFIITVDTEGDNLWNPVLTRSGLKEIKVHNADYIFRFQELCEKFSFIPTYLTNYEMSQAQSFVELARDRLKFNKVEIGMHMHAWNIPPLVKLPFNPKGNNPYAAEYHQKILYQKMKYITRTLEDVFQVPILSHRGGRWYLDTRYVRMLQKLNYMVDCTITPGISWEDNIGNYVGGCNYKKFPNKIYELDTHNMIREGNSGILEIPPTIIRKQIFNSEKKIIDNVKDLPNAYNKKIWLRPNGKNLEDMLYLVKKCTKNNIAYLEFMIHSSELMPGGSPTFPNKKSIEILYHDMEIVFTEISKNYVGIGLGAYAKTLI